MKMEVSHVIRGYSWPHSFPVGRIFCRENRTLAQPDITPPHLVTPAIPGYPTPDSSSLIDLDAPIWKLLNNRAFSSPEFASLIKETLRNEGIVELIHGLRREDAQALADLIQEVHSVPLFEPCDLITPFPPGSFAF